MFAFTQLPPLALYLHIPWCVRKCPYCDFNSHAVKDGLPEQQYVDALLRDLEQDLALVWGRRVQTLFMGGGTPSLFSPEALDRLMSGLRALISIQPQAEITLEANPGTFEQGKFDEFRTLGINRLSIGVQSFADDCLRALGRIHNSREAIRAVEVAHDAGFDNLNLDLMFGLPGQSNAMALHDVQQALSLEPAHLSWYQLTIEPNTLFHARPPQLPAEDAIWQMQQEGQALLAGNGFGQYEVSAYARPGRQCVHNLNYWQFGDYLGIGAGAHAKITDARQQTVTRFARVKHPDDYLKNADVGQHVASTQVLGEDDVRLEFMMNALRLVDGFDEALFEAHAGLALSTVEPVLQAAEERGLLLRKNGVIRASEHGQRYLDDLLQMFMQ